MRIEEIWMCACLTGFLLNYGVFFQFVLLLFYFVKPGWCYIVLHYTVYSRYWTRSDAIPISIHKWTGEQLYCKWI